MSKIDIFVIPIFIILLVLTALGTTNFQADSTHVPVEEYASASHATSGQAYNQYGCSNSIATGSAGMRDPSAVYCTEMGYEFRIQSSKDGEKGICVMPDDKECDSWAFYSGQCGEDYSYCARNGLAVSAVSSGDGFANECTTCVMPNGSVRAVSELLELGRKSSTGVQLIDERSSGSDIGLDIKDATEGGPLPSFFDWRDANGENWMTIVKDQGNCGSCWAFSAVGVVEAIYNIGYNNPDLDLNLSEQYLVSDCCTSCGHCCGGWMYTALTFIRDNGITDENCFPYVDSQCSCREGNCSCNYTMPCSNAICSDRCPDWDSRLVTIDDTAPIASTIESLKQSLIEKGPISAAMGYGDVVEGYWDDDHIYRCTNDSRINHGVIIVGYDETEDYWIVKNSWGTGWEDEGYFKVGFEECAIESRPYYATIETPTPTPTATPEAQPGDVNDDGIINCCDITQVELCILDPVKYPKENYPGWDANEDSLGPNAGDILAVEMRILGTWPPE